MYKLGDLKFGKKMDTSTENYDDILGAYLRHSCDEWVIGGKQEIENLIIDLQEILKKKYR